MVAPATYTPKEAAQYLGVSLRTFYTMLGKDAGLRACRADLGVGLARYSVAKLERWLRRRPARAVSS